MPSVVVRNADPCHDVMVDTKSTGAATVRFLFSINNGTKLILAIFVVGFVAGFVIGSGAYHI